MFKGFEHAGIAAADPQGLADWYVRLFAFEVASHNGRTPPTILLKAPDGTVLEILPAEDGQPGEYGQRQIGIRHLALRVDDFAAALQYLKDNGVSEFFDDRGSDSYHLIFFRDPEGNLLHLIWRPKPL